MLEKTKLYYLYLKNKLTVKKPWDMIIIFVLNILIAVPIFLIVHQNLIDFNYIPKNIVEQIESEFNIDFVPVKKRQILDYLI